MTVGKRLTKNPTNINATTNIINITTKSKQKNWQSK